MSTDTGAVAIGTAPLRFEEVPLHRAQTPLTLDIPAHGTTVLLGDEESGVGLLGQIALGLRDAMGGKALVLGQEIRLFARQQRLAYRRQVGYLPSGDGLLANLSLRDNVALPLRFGSDASEQDIEGRVRVILAAVRVSDAAALRPAQANEEQRRRAALARALAFDPALLILEQPFDGLTARSASQLLEVARGGETSQGARRTIFVTAQDLPDALRTRVERLYRLERGVLRAEHSLS
jgi:molybdate transport system ATP-binding protein/molybdate transport system permease protein